MFQKREKLLFYSITALGISSIITQLNLIREFLSVFYGNELILGIILANWLLLTGIGVYIGRFSDKIKEKIRFIIFSQILIAFLPFLSIFLIRALKNIIFPVGSLAGIVNIFISSFILLLPYCIISGILLTLFCAVFSLKKDAASIGKVYFIDNIGDIIGGVLFSLIFIYFLNPFQMIFFIMFINLLAALLLSIFVKKRLLKNILILLILFSFLFMIIDFNKISTSLQYKGQELVFQKNSQYGNIIITKTDNQLNFFENGIALFSTDNVISNEETVHYAMLQHKNPKEILLISGGVAGTTKEVLKYDIDKIDYVELDPMIIMLGKKYTKNLENKKISTITKDARLYVKQTNNKYDIVIIDLPDPSTAQLNRFYTIEFFKELKKKLNKDAVISISLISTENYISNEAKQLNSVLYKTLKQVFNNIIIIPGNKNFFIASDEELSYNIPAKVKEKNISTKYVNGDYLKGRLTKQRITYLLNSIDKNAGINRDFNPISHYYHLIYWLSYFKANYVLFLMIIFTLTLLYITKTKPISFAIFTTGFAASSLEVVLLIGFQIIYGYVYHMLGIIITMFMVGLAIGSFYMNKNLKRKNVVSFIKLEFLIVAYSILMPFILIALNQTKTSFIITQIIFSILTLIIAILVGMEFPLASKLQFKKVSTTAAQLYNADLIGASIGALLVSALLIPLIGLIKVCMIIAVLNIISGLIIIIKRKNYIYLNKK